LPDACRIPGGRKQKRIYIFLGKGLVMRRVVSFAVAVAVVLAIAGLLYAGNIKKLKKKLGQELSVEDYTSAAATIAELGEENSLEAVKVIVSVALNERIESQEVFLAAKEALSKITDGEAVNYLCVKASKAKARGWKLKVLFAEVLGNLKGEKVLETLIELLKDRQPEVVREAIIALKKQGDIKAVDALIDVLGKLEKGKGLVWVEVRKALTSLTGADYPTAEEWRQYWLVRKEELKANPQTPRPTGDGAPKTSLDEEKKKAPRFFGKEIMSKKILFIIDVSGSMIMKDKLSGEGGGAGKGSDDYNKIPEDRMRIKRAKKELTKAVKALPKSAKFNIIAFSMSIKSWQNKKLAPATSKNKQAALNFVKKFKAIGGTFTDDALKEAFANMEADTIFFLSDGAPQRYPESPDKPDERNLKLIDQCLEFVRKENKFRKVKIFTFAFDGKGIWNPAQGKMPASLSADTGRFVEFMKKLAKENGGEYKSIK